MGIFLFRLLEAGGDYSVIFTMRTWWGFWRENSQVCGPPKIGPLEFLTQACSQWASLNLSITVKCSSQYWPQLWAASPGLLLPVIYDSLYPPFCLPCDINFLMDLGRVIDFTVCSPFFLLWRLGWYFQALQVGLKSRSLCLIHFIFPCCSSGNNSKWDYRCYL